VRRAARSGAEWLDDRLGLRTLRRYLLDEPLPPGTGWWFTLGSVLLFGLAIQFVTGIVLAMYYAPTPDHAWDSVRYITTQVAGGAFLRGLHHWGASVVVVAAVIHMLRVIAFGSYKRPRELNWVIGLLLLLVILAFGLTGYLLPWDQRAYWATVVTISIARLTPIGGEVVAALLQGGTEVGALTLTRWYAIHVMVLPLVLIGLVVLHLYLLRRHGISGPVRKAAGPSQMFFPYQAARDLTMAFLVGAFLAVMAWQGAPALEPPADPTSSDYVPRPEWYFLGLFQLLKYFPGRLEVIGAIVIPGIVVLFLFLLPWIDRRPARGWRSRRLLLSVVAAGLAAVVTLTTLGALDRPATERRAWNIQERAGALLVLSSERCTRCHAPDGLAGPIEPGRFSKPQSWLAAHAADPEVIGPGVREPPSANEAETTAILAALARLRSGPPPPIDAANARLIALVNRHCLNCHIVNGAGGTDGPDLTNVGGKIDLDTITRRIANPTEVQADAEMPAFHDKLSAEEIAEIARWLVTRGRH
jgi:ubiquinol-cytochrome c reductase cytochrome b subunit